ncbi:MAG: hypothetical protein ACR2LR_16995, partial [Hassallia sp.]
ACVWVAKSWATLLPIRPLPPRIKTRFVIAPALATVPLLHQFSLIFVIGNKYGYRLLKKEDF